MELDGEVDRGRGRSVKSSKSRSSIWVWKSRVLMSGVVEAPGKRSPRSSCQLLYIHWSSHVVSRVHHSKVKLRKYIESRGKWAAVSRKARRQ